MNRAAWVRLGLFLVALGLAGALWFRALNPQSDSSVVPYSQLLAAVDEGKVSEVLLENERLVATLKDKSDKGRAQTLVASRIPNMDEHELVARLEKAGVAFSGRIERSSFWPAVLSSIFPIVMLIFLFRAMGGMLGGGRGAARPMSFGKSQAKIFDRSSENRTTFADVAGVDESKNELDRGGQLPQGSREIPGHRRARAQGRAAGGRSGHGQDAAGARGGRRVGRALLLDVGLGVRGDVRGRGRQPGARSLHPGQGARPLHRLHRRARRGGQDARGRRRVRGQRGARADPQPAAGGDGRLRRERGHRHHGGHQPARGARQGAAARRPLRSPGAGRSPRRARARGDPPRARQAADDGGGRSEGRRAAHAGHGGRRPGQRGERGRARLRAPRRQDRGADATSRRRSIASSSGCARTAG